jgi:DMSO reductase anchor subunit
MNPAPSIVFFTTASGAGYGLLFWLGLLRPLGLVPASTAFGLLALGLALLLITAGLFSSLLHLGHPERAWRALSQWRSSWLSREGVAALATYAPAGLLGLALAFGWPAVGTLAGLLAAVGAVATVWCTGMIYASLKPIRQWHHATVAPGYLLFSAFSGAALLAALSGLAGRATVPALLAVALGIASLLLKRRYWQVIDEPARTTTLETATGPRPYRPDPAAGPAAHRAELAAAGDGLSTCPQAPGPAAAAGADRFRRRRRPGAGGAAHRRRGRCRPAGGGRRGRPGRPAGGALVDVRRGHPHRNALLHRPGLIFRPHHVAET